MGKMVSGNKVLLKPNMVNANPPEKAITTHPSFIEAVIQVLKDYDCILWLGDSPNGVQKSLDIVWETTGIKNICDRYGVEKKYFERSKAVQSGDFIVSSVPLEADCIINLPKFKTHGLTILTGAVKNMFGIVPGLKKAAHHRDAPSREKFAHTLVKISEIKRPSLNIVDGIIAMAGNGPSGGYPVPVGLVAVGEDMHSVDYVLSKLMKVNPRHVDTLKVAEDLGLIDLNKDVPISGDDVTSFDLSGYKLPVTYTANIRNYRLFEFFISRCMGLAKVRPKVDKKKCVRCLMCKKICPVDAIKLIDGYPYIENKDCIECYCCHETCSEKAIDLRESLILKLIKIFR